ncbi:MAG: FHA domain-containing protein [Sedimentisphaerales bacterium]
MRVLLRQKDGNTKEFQFEKGPILIGRGADSNVFLPDRAVSRRHAMIINTEDGKWAIEDLDSTSKTYLNDEAIHKAELKHGDCIRITDFLIDLVMEEEISEEDKAMQLDDTLHLEAALAVTFVASGPLIGAAQRGSRLGSVEKCAVRLDDLSCRQKTGWLPYRPRTTETSAENRSGGGKRTIPCTSESLCTTGRG